jgi:hypothetical protein
VTRRSVALAIAFTVLETLVALGLVALSVHGPDGLPIAAASYFIVAVGITWWTARRFDSARVLLATGALALAAAPAIFALLGERDRRAYERRIAGTHVRDLRDQAILSPGGRAIGVRVSYTVTVPKRGYFGIVPSISSRDARTERLRLDARRWTIDGRSEPTPFEPGRVHLMDVELYPPLLTLVRGAPCLSGTDAPPLPDSVVRSRLPLQISETRHSVVFGEAELTRGEYDLAELYRGVLTEGFAPCQTAQ